jgi:FkbM family methyltransferase
MKSKLSKLFSQLFNQLLRRPNQLAALNLQQLQTGAIDKNTFYDNLTFEIIRQVLRPKSICVDVGCNYGEILTVMMQAAPQGKFYAFEPLPDIYHWLSEHFHQAHNLHLYDLALSNQAGEKSFNYVIDDPALSGFTRRDYFGIEHQDTQITVKTKRLDDIVLPREKIALIKIDVEGAELEVLQGSVATIARCKPVILFEHGWGAANVYGTKPEDIYDLLCGDCGLKISTLENWLSHLPILSREEFHRHFYDGLNYFFIAHPPRFLGLWN